MADCKSETVITDIRIFVRVNFWIRIYSDIRSWQDFDSNIFGYSFVSIFRTQTDSEDVFIDFLWILYFAYGYFVDINDQKCYLDCKSTELVPVLSRV